ncbi:MAG: PIN domain-containing protein [Geothrix sp.]|nr:PIN domain-containing protein [Geothrix sp.]
MEIFHVIIDTSVLTETPFKEGNFERLLQRVHQGVIKLYIPEVVLEERRTQLLFDYNKYAEEARAALRKMGRLPLKMLLEGLPLPEAVDLPSRDAVNRNSRAIFLKYLADNRVEVLPFSSDHAARAMERYMHGITPFKPAMNREPERKHIPDSWTLALVRIPPGLLAKNHPPRAVPFPGSAPFRLSWLTHPPCRYRGVDHPSFGLERPEAF